ncbi:MAG TPA: LCP family protein [Pseudonocardia sp.]|nr:LCP family protein [Pseudonocardia sp.]
MRPPRAGGGAFMGTEPGPVAPAPRRPDEMQSGASMPRRPPPPSGLPPRRIGRRPLPIPRRQERRPRPPTAWTAADAAATETTTVDPIVNSEIDPSDEGPDDLRRALLAAAAATVAPGSGHLLLGRRQTGVAILGTFLIGLATLLAVPLAVPRATLVQNVVSSRSLVIGAVVCLLAGLAWIGVIVRTYMIGRPAGLDPGRRAIGALTVCCLCLIIAAPLGYGANLANSQRNLLETLFRGGDGGTPAAEAIAKPRLNILLIGSDAGPDRTGARTDTMMVASIDTRSGRTTLFGLPRNIGYAQFPLGSPMQQRFPRGFHDRADPTSGDYLLNAVYAYGHQFPEVAPRGPTADPGLNLLHQTVSQMLGLQLDYYAEVNMAGFASIIDALGGVVVDVGPERIPIGGISPSGRLVRPDGYIEPGVQLLSGEQALAFARSRTNSTDYARMGRQRCLLQNILAQKSPTDVLSNFRAVAAATTNSVSTNIPQAVLPALVTLAGVDTLTLESLSFDPNLPDPNEPSGRFNTGDPDFPYMRSVVQDAINRDPSRPLATPEPTSSAPTSRTRPGRDGRSAEPPLPSTAEPTSLAASCA